MAQILSTEYTEKHGNINQMVLVFIFRVFCGRRLDLHFDLILLISMVHFNPFLSTGLLFY